jgi:hypothetical protein
MIEQANEIINEYAAQGYSLTLRQLYYQFVARDLISNTVKSYNKLGSIINDARLAGLVDWLAIEDRTRNINDAPRWDDPADAINAVLQQYRTDIWATQPRRVEVWIEKNALTGVIHRTCRSLDVPYFACIGYVSQSEEWRAYRRSMDHPLTILHLGDHDPSGIDMTRDNDSRLNDVFGGDVDMIRIALNMDQVEEYDPPPNPAKMTDSRFQDYAAQFGTSSWELDALEPSVINALITSHVEDLRDEDIYQDALIEQKEGRDRLQDIYNELENE